ncbi:MAG: hypothetical protein SGARI_001864, partial [Bacillariaceae sp.]
MGICGSRALEEDSGAARGSLRRQKRPPRSKALDKYLGEWTTTSTQDDEGELSSADTEGGAGEDSLASGRSSGTADKKAFVGTVHPSAIFKFLDGQSLLSLGCVSKKLNQLTKAGGQHRVFKLLEKYEK